MVHTATGRGLGKEEERPAGERSSAAAETAAACGKQVGTQVLVESPLTLELLFAERDTASCYGLFDAELFVVRDAVSC